MVALLISSYVVEIPLAWLLHGSLGVLGVCLAVLAGWTARLVVTWYRYRSGAWRTGLDLATELDGGRWPVRPSWSSFPRRQPVPITAFGVNGQRPLS